MSKEIFRYQYEYNKQSNKTTLLITIVLSLAFSSSSLGISANVLKRIFGIFLIGYLINSIKEDYHSDKFYSSVVDYSSRSNEPHLGTWKKIKSELDSKRKFYSLRILCKYSYLGFGKWNAFQMILGYLILVGLGLWLTFF